MKKQFKIKRLLSLLLIASTLIILLSSCKNDKPQDDVTTPSDTTTGDEQISEVTTTKPNYSELTYTGKRIIRTSKLGMRAATYETTDPYVVDVEITQYSVILYCYEPGKATISLADYFGRTAKIELEVKASTGEDGENKDDLIIATVEACTENIIEVSSFGATPDDNLDDTEAFQKAIDSANPGETVYVYPGRYDVSLLTMREGVTLKLYTEMTDAKVGYTDSIAKAVSSSRYAILSGTRILNNTNGAHGSEGCSNFSIIGGVFDTNRTTRSVLIFGCADNVRIENVIFKDIKGNHTIQLTGCTNSTVENCMFAGYDCGDTFTREIIQIEPSTPGATGGPLTFENGEYNCPKNITINNCYFGKSDEAGPPLMAIGHHSQVGEANVTGFKITNNVFDEVLYAAIRFNNLVDVEITNNTFRSTSAYGNATQFSQATTPAFLVFYLATGASTYDTTYGGGTYKVTKAVASEQAGHHNIRIEENTFTVGAGSDKRILNFSAPQHSPGVSFVSVTRQNKYNSPVYAFSGYSVNKNYIEDISFSKNNITFEGQPKYKDQYIYLQNGYDVRIEDNSIDLQNGTKFNMKVNGYEAGQMITAKSLENKYNYVIKTQSTEKKITIVFGDKEYILLSKFSGSITLEKESGGRITAENDLLGNLKITITPSEGYSLGEIKTISGSNVIAGENTITQNTRLSVTFKSN